MRYSIGHLLCDMQLMSWIETHWEERIVGFLFSYCPMNYSNWSRAKQHWPKLKKIIEHRTGLTFIMIDDRVYVEIPDHYINDRLIMSNMFD